MQKLARAIGAACVVALLALPAAGLGASEKGTGGKGRADSKPGQAHDLRSPHQKKQDALRQKALEQVLQGKAKSQKVMRVGDAKGGGQYVELARERTDRIFVLLVEFGNTRHASFCDAGQTCAFPGDGTALTYEGPENNKIRSRTEASTTRPSGSRTTASRTTRTCTSTAWRSTTSPSRRAGTRSAATCRPGCRSRSTRRATAVTSAAASSATTPGSCCVTAWRTGCRASSPAARPWPRSRSTSSRSTSGIATTPTPTGTSTSRTATSTTCRSCTRAATRPQAIPNREPMPSGATAGSQF